MMVIVEFMDVLIGFFNVSESLTMFATAAIPVPIPTLPLLYDDKGNFPRDVLNEDRRVRLGHTRMNTSFRRQLIS